MEEQQGLIAILDALGAARYGKREITSFLKSRQRVLDILAASAQDKEQRGLIEEQAIATFTFNDTVLITYRTAAQPTLQEIKRFCILLRQFEVASLAGGIMFRGSVAVGSFYLDRSSNTVMGTAVSDAAAWYNDADWIGIKMTPQSTMLTQALIERKGADIGHLLVDYPVPLKARPPMTLRRLIGRKAFTSMVFRRFPRATVLVRYFSHYYRLTIFPRARNPNSTIQSRSLISAKAQWWKTRPPSNSRERVRSLPGSQVRDCPPRGLQSG